jgi:hypothetical protein
MPHSWLLLRTCRMHCRPMLDSQTQRLDLIRSCRERDCDPGCCVARGNLEILNFHRTFLHRHWPGHHRLGCLKRGHPRKCCRNQNCGFPSIHCILPPWLKHTGFQEFRGKVLANAWINSLVHLGKTGWLCNIVPNIRRGHSFELGPGLRVSRIARNCARIAGMSRRHREI